MLGVGLGDIEDDGDVLTLADRKGEAQQAGIRWVLLTTEAVCL